MKFTDCKTASALLEFLDNDAHALSHKFYYHYTTFDIIKKIYRGKSIWLSQLCKTSNDICERKWYEEYGKTSFSVCFSTGSTESIPLWYLYSSKKGVGARLIISKSQMKRLWNNLSFVLAEIDGNKEIVLGSEIPLGKEDYRVAFRDILYVSRANKASCDHQRNDKSGIIRYNNDLLRISSDEIRAVTQSYMKFVKNQIWFYEKESRLDVELLKPELLLEDKSYVIIMDISSIIDTTYVMMAPDIDDLEGYQESVPEMRLRLSEYSGQFAI